MVEWPLGFLQTVFTRRTGGLVSHDARENQRYDSTQSNRANTRCKDDPRKVVVNGVRAV